MLCEAIDESAEAGRILESGAPLLVGEPIGWLTVFYSDPRLNFAFPTNDDFHTYRITTKGNYIVVYVDGALAIDGTGVFGGNWWTTRKMIAFGDYSHDAGSDSSWDYVRYSRCVWEVDYSADDLPSFSSPAWSPLQSPIALVESASGALEVNTLGNTIGRHPNINC